MLCRRVMGIQNNVTSMSARAKFTTKKFVTFLIHGFRKTTAITSTFPISARTNVNTYINDNITVTDVECLYNGTNKSSLTREQLEPHNIPGLFLFLQLDTCIHCGK